MSIFRHSPKKHGRGLHRRILYQDHIADPIILVNNNLEDVRYSFQTTRVGSVSRYAFTLTGRYLQTGVTLKLADPTLPFTFSDNNGNPVSELEIAKNSQNEVNSVINVLFSPRGQKNEEFVTSFNIIHNNHVYFTISLTAESRFVPPNSPPSPVPVPPSSIIPAPVMAPPVRGPIQTNPSLPGFTPNVPSNLVPIRIITTQSSISISSFSDESSMWVVQTFGVRLSRSSGNPITMSFSSNLPSRIKIGFTPNHVDAQSSHSNSVVSVSPSNTTNTTIYVFYERTSQITTGSGSITFSSIDAESSIVSVSTSTIVRPTTSHLLANRTSIIFNTKINETSTVEQITISWGGFIGPIRIGFNSRIGIPNDSVNFPEFDTNAEMSDSIDGPWRASIPEFLSNGSNSSRTIFIRTKGKSNRVSSTASISIITPSLPEVNVNIITNTLAEPGNMQFQWMGGTESDVSIGNTLISNKIILVNKKKINPNSGINLPFVFLYTTNIKTPIEIQLLLLQDGRFNVVSEPQLPYGASTRRLVELSGFTISKDTGYRDTIWITPDPRDNYIIIPLRFFPEFDMDKVYSNKIMITARARDENGTEIVRVIDNIIVSEMFVRTSNISFNNEPIDTRKTVRVEIHSAYPSTNILMAPIVPYYPDLNFVADDKNFRLDELVKREFVPDEFPARDSAIRRIFIYDFVRKYSGNFSINLNVGVTQYNNAFADPEHGVTPLTITGGTSGTSNKQNNNPAVLQSDLMLKNSIPAIRSQYEKNEIANVRVVFSYKNLTRDSFPLQLNISMKTGVLQNNRAEIRIFPEQDPLRIDFQNPGVFVPINSIEFLQTSSELEYPIDITFSSNLVQELVEYEIKIKTFDSQLESSTLLHATKIVDRIEMNLSHSPQPDFPLNGTITETESMKLLVTYSNVF